MLPAWFVVLMGMGTVFAGLILIIFLCKILSFFFQSRKKLPVPVSQKKKTESDGMDRGVLDAILAAAISETSGKSITAFRIVSIKKNS